MKILIDENLSPTLVQELAKKGVFAQHIAHLGRDGMLDPEIWKYAFDRDMVVLTLNASHFITLAGGSELHAGIIVLRGESLSRAEAWAWIEPTIDHLIALGGDLVNQILEVHGQGDFEVRNLPPP